MFFFDVNAVNKKALETPKFIRFYYKFSKPQVAISEEGPWRYDPNDLDAVGGQFFYCEFSLLI